MVDLITRLQVCAKFDPDQAEAIEVIQTQAARIAELEAALQHIIKALEDPTGGQHVFDMRFASAVARAALEGKGNDSAT